MLLCIDKCNRAAHSGVGGGTASIVAGEAFSDMVGGANVIGTIVAADDVDVIGDVRHIPNLYI
jgi:hypothetical protein